MVAPLNGLGGFDFNKVRHSGYSQTLFRLPLRTQASGLSDNIYDTRKLLELLDALREEARYLLLFLKSVCKIEVVQISQYGHHSTSFCVEIAPASLDASSVTTLREERDSFMQQLKQAHDVQVYKIPIISFTASFSVVITDSSLRNNQAGTSNWLIANCVGSADPPVQAAAAKQRTFPWVGTALELGGSSTGGRIFCFLPMPVETSSGLPIHVNGTFGLNDERRTLKWPGIDRRNDQTANWNKTLVSQLLPPCYAMLLTEAKKHLSSDQFYKAWPDVNIVKRTQFSEILKPLFAALFRQAVVWTERTEALQQVGNWVLISQATFISEGSSLPSVMKKVLSSCSVQLVIVPAIILEAIHFARIPIMEVSHRLARSNMRSYPGSYTSVDKYGKRAILSYCLSDSGHDDLSELKLLPLANGTFTTFDSYYGGQTVYLCSTDYPRSLLPNLDHLLVDLSDDPSLQMSLYQVAVSQQTRLRVLTEREVASLLPQAMPSNWRNSSLVSMPHSQLTFTWLQTFWNWLEDKNLALFSNQLLLPCYGSSSNSTSSFYLTRLSSAQPVVYVSSYTSCSYNLLSALYKMNVRVCIQSEFSFVQHKQLSKYVRYLDTNSVLDVVDSQASYKGVCFTADEAYSLRKFLSSVTQYSLSRSIKTVLQNLAIFSSASNSHSQLYSVSSASSQSVSRQALGEPSNCAINLSNLPPNLILFSTGNYHQHQLLKALKITFPSDYRLLVNYIFPLIRNRTLSDNLIDSLMTEVLDMFQVLNSRERSYNLSSSLQSLSFVKTIYGRKSPVELFNHLNDETAALYNGEDVFPQSPYNNYERIEVLKICGLCTSVTPQQALDIIYSISSSANSYPQHVSSRNLSRANAVLEYISKPSFYRQTSGYYTLPNTLRSCSFSDALRRLTTNRNWLPVLSDGPSGYCDELSWKGSGYSSHFLSLSSSVVVLTSSTAHTLPHLVGSQVYFVTPTVSPQIAAMLPTDSASIAHHLVSHFREIIKNKDQISVEDMDSLVHRVYSYLNSEGISALHQLYSIKEWIFIKRDNKFISPVVAALSHNPDFEHTLEPYVYILSDTLLKYTTLFGHNSKVEQSVSREQILYVLKMIRYDVQMQIMRITHQQAWKTVLNILNWLTDGETKSVSDDTDAADILVPVESQSPWPQLVQASEVVYTDIQYFRDSEESLVIVHSRISTQLARLLGVMPLSKKLGISEDTFKDAGQYEPLTTRLKNILRDYKDGITIIKELLQNADDAEATEVNICYDARQHETDHKKLFFSGMAEAHGPALIVHNNKTFSDDDFSNITKLAAATKQGKVLKIGKFGIGFCSVYHMTDVPSFISRDYLYIFDPTLSHLRKDVKNPAQPGKRVKFAHKWISRSGQLDPYNGLFGFNRTKSYQGTLFRLPFRTHASELSRTCYTKTTVRELISAIRENSTNLLLFLQHVRTITFQQIDKSDSAPRLLLKISRETTSLPLPLTLSSGIEVRNLSSTEPTQFKSCQWLVSQASESNSQEEYHTASVACPMGSSSYTVDPDFKGEIFCFLPLAQKTGLPVHVSSNFAVINNRRGIWTSDEAASKADREVMWNMTLMQGVIASAYHALLIALKELSRNGYLTHYAFHNLWPKMDKLLQWNPWFFMLQQLYTHIASDQLFYSSYHGQWLCLTESRFLTPGILCQSSEQLSTPKCVLEVLKYLNVPVVDLPTSYHRCFSLETVLINESAFMKLFFTHLEYLVSDLNTRLEVIQHMLEVYAAEHDDRTVQSSLLYDYFQNYPCIPCTPDGKLLRKCTQVVDSTADFASLFDSSEGHFPLQQLLNRHLSHTALTNLGMISKTIPYDMLVERAQTIESLYKTDKAKALKRIKLILSSCTKVKKNESQLAGNVLSTTSQEQLQQRTAPRVELSSVPFLPVLPRPEGYHLPWKGDGCDLMCGKALMIERSGRYGSGESINARLAGSQVAIVNENSSENGGCGYIVQSTIDLLEIRRSPSVEEVVAHLTVVQQAFQSQPAATKELVSSTDRMCRQVYGFLDGKLKSNTGSISAARVEPDPLVLQSLQRISCVWTGNQFVEVELIAKESWSINGPYLYCVPSILSFQKNLTKALCIKEHFSFQDVKLALNKMKEDFKDQPVDERCQNILKDIVSLLQKIELKASDTYVLMLPDEHYILHPSDKLAYNDVDWAPRDPNYIYVHEILPSHLTKILSIQPARSKILEKFDSSSSQFKSLGFGQYEELTLRIQNILRDYPLDITIIKELLQNADDAKATKMYFILDKRTHGKQGILSHNWEKLQGPALLVWNDSVFSEENLQGIQELGLGSKRSDAETIGQYGIGFNVVYHLTDCPSFITGGETMCVLDPHCEYVHEASKMYPGRRFDGLSKGFWKCFPDMSSAYLQSGLENCPPELQGGTLFRFPLRTTKAHLKSSRIIHRDKEGKPTTEYLTCSDIMSRMLNSWSSKMKEAMLFLNHIVELQFVVIEESSNQLEVKKKFCSEVDDSAQQSRKTLRKALSSFKSRQSNKSVVIRYPLTIKNIHRNLYGRESSTEEKWLIQQGVGDIDNDDQFWSFTDNVQPRHGIAAPIPPPQKQQSSEAISAKVDTFSGKVKFKGTVFCFLPLPECSNLPVHINGSFILNSNRRNLWKSTEEGREDDRSAWNNRLFQAIASSYANLLEHARKFYVSSEPYKTWTAVNNVIDQYYNIFPHTKGLEKQYKALAERVYQKLVKKNTTILAVVSSETSDGFATSSDSHEESDHTLKLVSWYPPKSSSPSTQVYFWSYLLSETIDWKCIKKILEDLGMKLVVAKTFLQDHLNKAIEEDDQKIKSTCPDTVFEYYCKFSAQASHTGQFPCAITESVFENVDTFKMFTEYLLQKSESKFLSVKELTFPREPFGHPLLLTADNQLRMFQENAKVIKSSFSHLFLNCLEVFLHPDLADLCYKSDYFVSYISGENSYSLSLVDSVLSKHLPLCLRTRRLPRFPSGLSRDQLRDYWECFESDPVLRYNVLELLKEWALLPNDSGSLHSASDPLVPVMPLLKAESDEPFYSDPLASVAPLPKAESCDPFYSDPLVPVAPLPKAESGEPFYSDSLVPVVHDQEATERTDDDDLCELLYQVLQWIGMPILDTVITRNYIPQCCPNITNKTAILKAIVHLNEERDLSCILGNMVEIVISYLSKINFRQDQESLEYVRSLPLFECVDGEFRAVVGRTAYIWPSNASNVGLSEWSLYVPNVIFLEDNACWTQLGSARDLGISVISAEQLYFWYIFKYFYTLSESARYHHLTHIKDALFPRNKMYKDNKAKCNSEDRQIAILFFRELQNLQCIGKVTLKCISDFCNHEVAVLSTFSNRFCFLPDFFQKSWEEWFEFFQELGLKCTVSQDEFQDFCLEIANGKHGDPNKASSVLLDCLCSDIAKKAGWHEDNYFLRQVRNIPFLPTLPLPSITWIKGPQYSSNSVVVTGRPVSLTSLSKAATPKCAICLWTVKPIIELPTNLHPDYNDQHWKLVQKFGITRKPTVTDVIQNIRNIAASTRFTDIQHFDQYPESNRPPDTPEAKSLMSVMVENLRYLERNHRELNSAHIQLLRETPCIPVYSTFEETHSWQVVLVRPSCVLDHGVITTDIYHPYLHSLAPQLSYLSFFLQQIGVESTIGFKHIQYVLETVYSQSGGEELDLKTRKCVLAVLTELYVLLTQHLATAVAKKDTTAEIGKALYPLYLPNSKGRLALSTTLIYIDSDNFKGKIIPTLEGTQYTMLKIRDPDHGVAFFDEKFCDLLPEITKPIGLSSVCSQAVLPECAVIPHTSVGKVLTETFEMRDTLSKAISACVQQFALSQLSFEYTVSQYLSSLEIKTVNHLRLAITFTETHEMFGELDTKFHLQESSDDDPNDCLYVDSQMTTQAFLIEKMSDSLTTRLLHIIKAKHQLVIDNYQEVFVVVGHLLKVQHFHEVKEIMEHYYIPMAGKLGVDKFSFVLGRVVPEHWRHRLHQTVENVFHPGETVGYEMMDNHIVYARIMHPILPEGVEFYDIPRISMIYMILTSPEDEEGTPVSVLKLYKFLKSAVRGGTDLVPSTEAVQTQELQREGFQDICSNLKQPREFCKREQSSASPNGGGGVGSSRWGAMPAFDEASIRPERNPREGRRWLKQAQANYSTLLLIHSGSYNDPKVCGDVCFMAHQVAEKALKGGKYFVCGLDANSLHSHNISTHAYGLQSERPGETHGLAAHTTPLEQYYLDPRYPNRWPSGVVPADRYTYQQAEEAKNHAQAILDIIKNITVNDPEP